MLNIKDMAHMALEVAKLNLQTDGCLVPALLIVGDDDEEITPINVMKFMGSNAGKSALAELIRALVAKGAGRVGAVGMVIDGWITVVPQDDKAKLTKLAKEGVAAQPDKGEAIVVNFKSPMEYVSLIQQYGRVDGRVVFEKPLKEFTEPRGDAFLGGLWKVGAIH